MTLKLSNRVLAREEIASVIAYHKQPRRLRRLNTHRNFVIFRLSCCCGLRRKEISGLELRDFFLKSSRPCLRVRKETTKGHRRSGNTIVQRKDRVVSLSVDRETRDDLACWLKIRLEQSGGDLSAPFISGQTKANMGKRVPPNNIARMWRTSLLCLGTERANAVSIHGGRHTYGSILAHDNLPLPFIRDNMGHRNVSTTSLYLHSFDEGELEGNAFCSSTKNRTQADIAEERRVALEMFLVDVRVALKDGESPYDSLGMIAEALRKIPAQGKGGA